MKYRAFKFDSPLAMIDEGVIWYLVPVETSSWATYDAVSRTANEIQVWHFSLQVLSWGENDVKGLQLRPV